MVISADAVPRSCRAKAEPSTIEASIIVDKLCDEARGAGCDAARLYIASSLRGWEASLEVLNPLDE
jgi:hypothetical protein